MCFLIPSLCLSLSLSLSLSRTAPPLQSFDSFYYIGDLSDGGRKPVFTIQAVLSFLPSLCLMCYVYLHGDPHAHDQHDQGTHAGVEVEWVVYLYFILRALCGVAQSISISLAALADVTPLGPARTKAFGAALGASTSPTTSISVNFTLLLVLYIYIPPVCMRVQVRFVSPWVRSCRSF